MRRRFFAPVLLACSLIVSGVLATGLPAASAAGTASAAAFDPSQPHLQWGAYARPRGSENLQSALQKLETKAGRTVGASRVYKLWDGGVGTYEKWLVSTGREPLISVKPQNGNGSAISWNAIANAPTGSTLRNQINGWADKIKSLGGPVYFTFNHEPEAAASNKYGTSPDFIRAWRKIVDVFRQRGVTNAKFLWIMTGWAFNVNGGDKRAAAKWYPGDSYVDALGSDEYNEYTCRADHKASWRDLGAEIETFRQFGLQHPSEELWLPEFGSFEDSASPGRKAAWMNTVRTMFKSSKYAQFRGIVYFHAIRVGTPCVWWLDSSSSATSAWAAMGKDAFYTKRG